MATYRVWLKVKDGYGNTKELDGGTINVDLATLTPDEVDHIEDALPLQNYIKRENLDTELDAYATDAEVLQALQNNNTIRYSDFELREEDANGGDI